MQFKVPPHLRRADYVIGTRFLRGETMSKIKNFIAQETTSWIEFPDIDMDRMVIKVFGKGSKERLVPFNETAHSSLVFYLQERQKNKKFSAIKKNYV